MDVLISRDSGVKDPSLTQKQPSPRKARRQTAPQKEIGYSELGSSNDTRDIHNGEFHNRSFVKLSTR